MRKWNEQEIFKKLCILGCAQDGSLEIRAIAVLYLKSLLRNIVHSIECLLSVFYVLSNVLNAVNTVINKIDKKQLTFRSLYASGGNR